MSDTPPVTADADGPDTDAPTDAVVEPEPELLHGALVVHQGDTAVLHVGPEGLVELVTKLRGDGFWQCIDLCGVDYLTHPGRSALPAGVTPERFEVVVSLLNHNEARRVRIRVQVPESDPTVPTLFKLHPGTEAMEREAWDLYGIVFEGHPDLTRILLPDEWSGHPLRKDYAIGKIPVQFKAARTER
jgi:NADH-quinone oxidoreductase subunit C